MIGSLTERIRERAQELGFNLIGFAPVRPLEEERKAFEEYLDRKWHGGMTWLQSAKEPMLHPDLILKHSRSIISLAINYYNEIWEQCSQEFYGSFSRYTYGKDYHTTIEAKLRALARFLKKEAGGDGRPAT